MLSRSEPGPARHCDLHSLLNGSIRPGQVEGRLLICGTEVKGGNRCNPRHGTKSIR
jgi:hypothetical protein